MCLLAPLPCLRGNCACLLPCRVRGGARPHYVLSGSLVGCETGAYAVLVCVVMRRLTCKVALGTDLHACLSYTCSMTVIRVRM
jgi:hypothetical protein